MQADLRSFVESRLPLIVHAMEVWRAEGSSKRGASKPPAKREKYAFQQAFFYGAMYFMNRDAFVSERALELSQQMNIRDRLWRCTWEEQPKFDRDRARFHLEHMFTGGMCWTATANLFESNRLNVDSVEALLRENYAVAWITKEENRKLPRSHPGTTLKDALERYAGVKPSIVLLDRNGKRFAT